MADVNDLRVVLMCGLPASGKTTTAARVHAAVGGTLIRSCDVYQALGIDLPAWVRRTHSLTRDVHAYERERDRAYDVMAERLAQALEATAAPIVVDAVHGERTKRERMYAVCEAAGARPLLLHCRCDDDDEVARRIAARRGRETEPEHEAADLSVHRHIRELWDPPDGDAAVARGEVPRLVYDTLTDEISGATVASPLVARIRSVLAAVRAPALPAQSVAVGRDRRGRLAPSDMVDPPALPARCLMVQGTGSGVGKSLIATALCRLFSRAGYRVAPFKSQNMALNAAVTVDGGEIGRAQAAQAEAAGIEPSVDMNPILLKPESDHRAQVVVRGVARATVGFRDYERMKPELLPIVVESLARLRASYDLVVIEGAGSPAEINLQEGEIVNMRIARLADAPVLLVGDIDRGGVLAAFVGTLALLPADDRARVAGFVVNRFRGDASLLAPGLAIVTERTGVPVLGVLPYITERLVPAEDSLDLEELVGRRAGHAPGAPATGADSVEIGVVGLPRISNFDDFEPLAAESGVRLRLVRTPTELGGLDLIVLPGSKSTVADLAWLRETGLAAAIREAASEGRPVLGICGGYQMLGTTLEDPAHVESSAPTTEGLALLPVTTTFEPDKRTVRVRARAVGGPGLFGAAAPIELSAYEIHAGRTRVTGAAAGYTSPFTIVERAGVAADDADGLADAAGTVVGTYLHGLFVNDAVRGAVLDHVARRSAKRRAAEPPATTAAARYDRLADIVGGALDLPAIAELVGLDLPRR